MLTRKHCSKQNSLTEYDKYIAYKQTNCPSLRQYSHNDCHNYCR